MSAVCFLWKVDVGETLLEATYLRDWCVQTEFMPTRYVLYWLCTKMFLGLNTVKYRKRKETQSQCLHLQGPLLDRLGWGWQEKCKKRECTEMAGSSSMALIPFPRGTRAKPIKQNNNNNKFQTNQNVLYASASKCNKEDTKPQLNTLLCPIRKWDKGIMQK